MKKYVIIAMISAFAACHSSSQDNNKTTDDESALNTPKNISYQVVNIYPHDSTYFTEGFFLKGNDIYESTGLEGKSKLIHYRLKDGTVLQSVSLASQYFGEGISIIDNKLYQLTYQTHNVFVYSLPDLKKIKEFSWPYEGWGMTTDGKNLLISTGSSQIYYVNPDDFKIIKTINVTNNYGPLSMINELEYVNGMIYSNVWQTNNIVKIDPATGKVVGVINLENIRAENNVQVVNENFLNGIAYDSTSKHLLVTGKNWPKTFELKLSE